MTLHALYSLHHTHYRWQLIYSVWCHIHYMWYITQWLYLWYQTLYVQDIFTLYGITHSVVTIHHCVPSQPLCLILHSKYFWRYTKWTNFMTRSECKWSQPLYVWHHMHYIWHHIHSLWHQHVTSYPLYICYPIHYVWQHITVCCWYHTQHMCDIFFTTDDITYTLSHQTTVFMMSHPFRAWHHNHSIRHRTHCIFIITTSPLIS